MNPLWRLEDDASKALPYLRPFNEGMGAGFSAVLDSGNGIAPRLIAHSNTMNEWMVDPFAMLACVNLQDFDAIVVNAVCRMRP